MVWDDAPPSPEELQQPVTAKSWDSDPPTPTELGTPAELALSGPAPGSLSLPTSLGDAWTRVQQGGLFRTPAPEGQEPTREGPLPAPATLGNAVAGVAQKIGGMIPETVGNVGKALLQDTVGRFIPSTVKAIGAALPESATSGTAVVAAAARMGPQAAAIAHYLTSQRDPAYAASLQKKDK